MLHAYRLEFEYKNRFIIVSRDDFFGKLADIAPVFERSREIFKGWRE
jgi:hypothetical protein